MLENYHVDQFGVLHQTDRVRRRVYGSKKLNRVARQAKLIEANFAE